MYFPACINRIFGHSNRSDREPSLPEALVAVSRRAGMPLWIPDDVRGACCGTVWHSISWAYERVAPALQITRVEQATRGS